MGIIPHPDDNYNEYVTPDQHSIPYLNSFDITVKAPFIAKRIWATLSDAENWLVAPTSTAVAGLNISVISDDNPENNGLYNIQYLNATAGTLQLVKLSNSSDVNSTIGEMNVTEYPQANINTTFGVNTTILTIESIYQRNGVIGAGDSFKTDIAIDGIYNPGNNKIATQDTVRELNSTIGNILNTVVGEINTTIGELTADDISANYNTTAGRIQNTVQGAIDYMTERIQDLEALPTYETIVCSTAQNTPSGITWKNEQGETITGELPAGENTKHKIYLVPQKTVSGGDNFDEYITIYENGYVWEKVGSTAGVFEGIEEVADGLVKDEQPSYAADHYIIQNNTAIGETYGKLVSAVGQSATGADTYQKSSTDGLTMASDVKAYVDTVSRLTMDIAANGVNIGNVKSGETVFTVGESISYILKQILTKTIGIKVNANPTINITGLPNKGTTQANPYEVGETVDSISVNSSINNSGSYISMETGTWNITKGYNYYSGSDVTTTNGKLNAQCVIKEQDYSLYSPDNKVSATISNGVISQFTAIEGLNLSVNAVCGLQANVEAYNNLNELCGVRIGKTTYYNATRGAQIFGAYKYFYGYAKLSTVSGISYETMFNTQAKIEDALAGNLSYATTFKQKWCTKRVMPDGWFLDGDNRPGIKYVVVDYDDNKGDDNTGTMKGPDDKPVMVIIIPSTYYILTSFSDGLFVNAPGNWQLINDATVSYTKGSTITSYTVYMVTPVSPTAQNRITFTNETLN